MEKKSVNQNADYIMTKEQMRLCDAGAIESTGIPGVVLMENAALAVIDVIKERFSPKDTSFAIFAGKGNNAGDGFAIARHLYNMGSNVVVYLTQGSFFDGDANTNYRIIRSLGIPVIDLSGEEYIKNYIESADCVVDAIFGTGLSGSPRGVAADAISAINKYSCFTISVDIPSGVDANTGDIFSEAVKADITVTFQAYKRGLLLYPGAENSGEVILKDIGIPKYILESRGGRMFAPIKEDILNAIPKRRDNSNKSDYGKLFVVGGSVGMAGAVSMSLKASLRCGVGLVTAAVPQSINNIIQTKIDEAMTMPLPDQKGKITSEMWDKVADRANKCDAVLIGPGIGRGEEVTEFVINFLKALTVPVVIDADAIYALSKKKDIIKEIKTDIIITPHSKELEYLTGIDVGEIEKDRPGVAIDTAKELGLTLVLKGHHTIIAAPDGDSSVNLTGNSGMAGAGSGDVLSGMIGAFLAKGMTPYDAAVSGVYLHGLAGDIAMKKLGKESMNATDIIDSICQVLPVEN